MPIGLIAAIPQELAHLRSAMGNVQWMDIAHTRFDTGSLDGCDVVLAETGMGKVNAALVTTVLAHRFGCRAVIFSGVAGGLDPDLNVGDVVIADRLIQYDAGLIEDERLQTYQAGHVPFINPTDRLGYDVGGMVIDKVRRALGGLELPPLSRLAGGQGRPARIVYGTVLSGDQYLHSEPTRVRLHSEFGGRAIEMEGGAVAQVCEAFGIDWLVVRALSDLAGQDSQFEFNEFAGEVAASSATVLRTLLPVL
ncbi:5'-methylthioadenosine/adenosylhomocysteine nucleosidase [Mycolicibacterium mageritense]|uniref:adenosylhomocysteine nucleosidase n=1 Tax=Mycolicibacterium mageritense TaxID=53462 RepID=A0AAI8TTA0_MYCME|nr:5'-methylthioadenosine/adenosylhomocysteine nucleosidase [Mycolicibacterium mageritense]BDY30528.1 5'-methylthioadenosine/S-adenosylhomocysteine nucleosidase [Mycolicibacterium mageritense]